MIKFINTRKYFIKYFILTLFIWIGFFSFSLQHSYWNTNPFQDKVTNNLKVKLDNLITIIKNNEVKFSDWKDYLIFIDKFEWKLNYIKIQYKNNSNAQNLAWYLLYEIWIIKNNIENKMGDIWSDIINELELFAWNSQENYPINNTTYCVTTFPSWEYEKINKTPFLQWWQITNNLCQQWYTANIIDQWDKDWIFKYDCINNRNSTVSWRCNAKLSKKVDNSECNYDECLSDWYYVIDVNNKNYPLWCRIHQWANSWKSEINKCILRVGNFYISSSMNNQNISIWHIEQNLPKCQNWEVTCDEVLNNKDNNAAWYCNNWNWWWIYNWVLPNVAEYEKYINKDNIYKVNLFPWQYWTSSQFKDNVNTWWTVYHVSSVNMNNFWNVGRPSEKKNVICIADKNKVVSVWNPIEVEIENPKTNCAFSECLSDWYYVINSKSAKYWKWCKTSWLQNPEKCILKINDIYVLPSKLRTTWYHFDKEMKDCWDVNSTCNEILNSTWNTNDKKNSWYASNYCNSLEFGWSKDWYLPNVFTWWLLNIYHNKSKLFTLREDYYWSSTYYKEYPQYKLWKNLDMWSWRQSQATYNNARNILCISNNLWNTVKWNDTICEFDECLKDDYYVIESNNKDYPNWCATSTLKDWWNKCILKIWSYYLSAKIDVKKKNHIKETRTDCQNTKETCAYLKTVTSDNAAWYCNNATWAWKNDWILPPADFIFWEYMNNKDKSVLPTNNEYRASTHWSNWMWYNYRPWSPSYWSYASYDWWMNVMCISTWN